MKTFFSAKKRSESDGDLFDSLLNLIDSKYIRDKAQILKDIAFHESFKDGKGAQFGTVFVHTARTQGISEFCLAALETENGTCEVLILWDDISEHHLGKLAEIADFFERNVRQQKTNGQIIAELQRFVR